VLPNSCGRVQVPPLLDARVYLFRTGSCSNEYMCDAAAVGRAQGIGSVMISNGYIQEKPLRELCQQLTAVKIDFKAFHGEVLPKRPARRKLQPVLSTLQTLKDIGIWFELVMLVVPTLNDFAGWR